MLRIFILLPFLGLFIGCEEPPLEDTEEQLCSQVSGTWAISNVTCEGSAQTIGSMRLFLDHTAGTVTHYEGGSDCTVASTFNSVFDFSSSVQLTGSGNVFCSQNETDVNSCTGVEASCDNTTSVNGIANDFTQCVVANETTMTLSRTVTSQHISDGVSTCTEGQAEVMTLVPQTSTPVAVLAVSDGPTYDFGNVGNGSHSNYTLTVTNTGTLAATTLSGTGLISPFEFLGGTYPGTGGTCTTNLASAASCTIVVNFSPTANGSFLDSIELNYNDGVSNQTASRAIQGTGVTGTPAAMLVISETDPYDFGNVNVGSDGNQIFTVTNAGSATATSIIEVGLAAPFSFLGGTYPGTGGDCGATLAAAATCNIVVTFSPATASTSNDTIELSYNNALVATSATRAVQGTGVGTTPAILFISDGPVYDFGNVNTTNNVNYSFTVTNTGGTTATAVFGSGLAAPYSFSGGAYPGTGGTCSSTIAAGSTCQIVVEFNPLAVGVANDSLFLDYNDGSAAQQAARNITGTGI